MQQGKLLVISGPSAGVGKDTIRAMFLAKHNAWQNPLSTTTRPARPSEAGKTEMSFTDQATFEGWQSEGKFLETDFHAGYWYGTLKDPVERLLNEGKNVLLRVDVNGALKIKQVMPGAVIVFIAPDSVENLESRIRKRAQDDEATIRRRLKLAKKELEYKDQFDHVIINPEDHPEKALADLEKALNP